MTKSIKISVLWLLTICGFACHSICDNAGQYVIMPMMILVGIVLAWYSIKYVKKD